LLDEVTALVEWPKVYECHFDHEFLSVPQECLILTMQTNQKYFPCTLNGVLRNRFLVVSNVETAEPASIVGGNERVVRPRLADAKFFFDQDRKKTLGSHVKSLDKVMYHNKLGTQGERMLRVSAIAKAIGETIGERLGDDTLAALAGETARLAKADLLTDMVGEFPELQGIMGRYYAQHDGLSDEIAFAIEDHYKPRFAGDILPRNMVGICVALADKLETLVGMFRIGQTPTGDKDPFALRRHALGVIRILIEKELPLALDELIERVGGIFENSAIHNVSPRPHMGGDGAGDDGRRATVSLSHKDDKTIGLILRDFVYDRLSANLREQGYTAQEVDAVVALHPQFLGDIPKRLAAVRAFAALPEAAALAAVNKRVGNILKKMEGDAGVEIKAALLRESAEQTLHQALSQIAPEANVAFRRATILVRYKSWLRCVHPWMRFLTT